MTLDAIAAKAAAETGCDVRDLDAPAYVPPAWDVPCDADPATRKWVPFDAPRVIYLPQRVGRVRRAARAVRARSRRLRSRSKPSGDRPRSDDDPALAGRRR